MLEEGTAAALILAVAASSSGDGLLLRFGIDGSRGPWRGGGVPVIAAQLRAGARAGEGALGEARGAAKEARLASGRGAGRGTVGISYAR